MIPFKFIANFNKIRNVVLADDTIVPGCSEMILDVSIDEADLDSWCYPQEFLIDPPEEFRDKYETVDPPCYIEIEITGEVPLMNHKVTAVRDIEPVQRDPQIFGHVETPVRDVTWETNTGIIRSIAKKGTDGGGKSGVVSLYEKENGRRRCFATTFTSERPKREW